MTYEKISRMPWEKVMESASSDVTSPDKRKEKISKLVSNAKSLIDNIKGECGLLDEKMKNDKVFKDLYDGLQEVSKKVGIKFK